MTQITKYPPGTFCWAELATTDAVGAKKFYQGLFGWSVNEFPIGEGGNYIMAQLEQKDVAAMYSLFPQQRAQGTPSHWLAYISVADSDASTAKAKKLGAKILKAPFDVFDVGRMAALQDPAGANFALWQPKKHIGATLKDQPGAVCWNELVTADVDAAGKFYSQLFNWKIETQKFGEMQYRVLRNGETTAGGMLQAEKRIPSHWTIYFAAENCDRSVEKVKSLGGKVCVPATDIPGIGRFAAIEDPQGAMFAIIQMSPK